MPLAGCTSGAGVTEPAGPGSRPGLVLGTTTLIRASWAGTAVLVVTAMAAVIVRNRSFDLVVVIPSLVLFALGCAAFLWAFGVAVGRSRYEEIGIGGLYFASGSAPPAVRNQFLASLGLEVVVALGTAFARPFTAQAFAVLAPMYGLGVAGLWGAWHGRFGPRIVEDPTPTGDEP